MENAEKVEPKAAKALEEVENTNVRVMTGSEAYNEALLQEPPHLMNGTTIKLFLCLMVGFFCQTMNGFDGSLFSGLLANKIFLGHFHGENSGIWAGIVSAMYIANASVGQFMGGRFMLGFGVSIVASAGPIYVVETTHPVYRGVVTGYCNTFWFIGSILSSGTVRGAITLTTNESWQIPIWLQMVFAGLVICLCWAIPESPRWLYVNRKQEKAVQTLTKWHRYGNPNQQDKPDQNGFVSGPGSVGFVSPHKQGCAF